VAGKDCQSKLRRGQRNSSNSGKVSWWGRNILDSSDRPVEEITTEVSAEKGECAINSYQRDERFGTSAKVSGALQIDPPIYE